MQMHVHSPVIGGYSVMICFPRFALYQAKSGTRMAKRRPNSNITKPAKAATTTPRAGVVVSQSRLEMRSGPMPDAEELARYESVVPGAAERIMKTYEAQVAHRHYLERITVESGVSRSRQGLVAGFIISMTAMVITVIALLTGHEIAGTVIGGGSLVGLVTVFFTGRAQQRAERRDRDEKNP
jgi:uncharacterized membrane protein